MLYLQISNMHRFHGWISNSRSICNAIRLQVPTSYIPVYLYEERFITLKDAPLIVMNPPEILDTANFTAVIRKPRKGILG